MSLKCKKETMSTKFSSAKYWYCSMIDVTFMAIVSLMEGLCFYLTERPTRASLPLHASVFCGAAYVERE